MEDFLHLDFSIPSLPDYNALHVLVVHFPIALFVLVIPLLLLLAVFLPRLSRSLAITVCVLAIVGAGGAWLASSTGQAAEDLARQQGAMDDRVIHDAIERHAEDGETARNVATAFAVLFLLYVIFSGLPNREWSGGVNGVVLFVFLLISLAGALHVANTAHAGGQLVHVHGITAPLDSGSAAAAAAAGGEAGESDGDADDDSAAAPVSGT